MVASELYALMKHGHDSHNQASIAMMLKRFSAAPAFAACMSDITESEPRCVPRHRLSNGNSEEVLKRLADLRAAEAVQRYKTGGANGFATALTLMDLTRCR